MIHYLRMDSPLGGLLLAADEEGLRCAQFDGPEHAVVPQVDWCASDTPLLKATRAQLEEYFVGRRQHFDLPLAPRGTEFQQRVWAALRTIPHGLTASYADIARTLGDAKAVRAVGMANARNPIAIVVPCHRVIGADGSLTGYAGGLERKRALLALEGASCVAGLFAEQA